MDAQTKPKAIAYFRVSKSDGRMHTENQKPEVYRLAEARGLQIVEVYEDKESAVRHRPAYERMLTDLRRGKFGPAPVAILWSLDRLARGFQCFDVFRELTRINVRVVSIREPWTDCEGPVKELLVAVMGWVSGFERQRLIERTKAGLDRARRAGRKIGRPKVILLTEDLNRALALRESGLGVRKIVQQLKTKIGPSTLHKMLVAHDILAGNGPCPQTGVEEQAIQVPDLSDAA